MKFAHNCGSCGNVWGHPLCELSGDSLARQLCPTCLLKVHARSYSDIDGWEYKDSFEAWVNEIRKAAGVETAAD